MANVLKAPEHIAKLGYNGFPMQQYLKFSSTVGELLPVYFDLLYPGDKVSGHVEHRTRTMPLETAAMCHVEEHFDWFAVPLDQIYSLSSAMLTGVRDIHSSLINDQIDGAENDSLFLPFMPSSTFSNVFANLRDAEDFYFKHDGNPHGLYLRGTSLRLMELLGIPLAEYDRPSVTNPNLYPLSVSLIWAAAYQKIYYDYFRLSDREVNKPSAYNFDNFLIYGGVVNNQTDPFILRYRAASADFFTHNYISPLFGMASDQGLATMYGSNMNLSNMFRQWLVPVEIDSRGASGFDLDHDATEIQGGADTVTPATVSNYLITGQPVDALSPAALTTTFATRKFLEITRRSSKHLDAQTLAHFGVKVPKRISGEVEHLAHSVSTIVIGDVISTAATEEGSLGQVGGKGYNAAKSGKFSYTNNEACPVVLMCIYSAAPVYDYRQIGIDRLTTLIHPEDMVRPEFDNLGMQPQFEFQSRMHFSTSQALNYGVIGWQYRWMELKCKQNRVCGALARSLHNWTTYKDNVSASLRSRLVSPFDLDSIMVKNYDYDAAKDDSTLWPLDFTDPNVQIIRDPFDSDPLIHECYFDVKKASKMSAYGLESL